MVPACVLQGTRPLPNRGRSVTLVVMIVGKDDTTVIW